MLTYSEVDLNGNLINDSNKIADAFNDYFSKVTWKHGQHGHGHVKNTTKSNQTNKDKQGKRNCVDNYRPISIVPVVAKAFERIIYDQVHSFISENRLLTNCQSGFRGLHSTVTALLEATNEWAYDIDNGNVNAVMFLDLKKAFDTVDHEILLSKLNACGIKGIASSWFRSYFNQHNYECFVKGKWQQKILLSHLKETLKQYIEVCYKIFISVSLREIF